MKRAVPLLIVMSLLCVATIASAQSEGDYDKEIASAGAAYRAALKSKNPAEITQTHEGLRAAREKLASYNQLLAGEHLRPTPGETRAQQLELLRAQSDYRNALSSGNPTVIQKARQTLRAAYESHWAVMHPHEARTPAGRAT